MNNDHIKTGVSGENIVSRYLNNSGFKIVARNVRYKCGELDFVAKRGEMFHFIEVKTARVIRETSILSVLPIENLHFKKIQRLKRSIQLYFALNKLHLEETQWQFDLVTVVIHETKHMAKLQIYEDLIL